MAAPTQIVEGLWQLSLGSVNVFLLDPLDSARGEQGIMSGASDKFRAKW